MLLQLSIPLICHAPHQPQNLHCENCIELVFFFGGEGGIKEKTLGLKPLHVSSEVESGRFYFGFPILEVYTFRGVCIYEHYIRTRTTLLPGPPIS